MPDELTRWRGGLPRRALTPRRIAGLLEVPGCARRETLDAAELPLDTVAALLDCPPGRQSPFAHARRRQFDAVCTADDLAALLDPVRETLGVPVRRGLVREVPAGTVDERAAATAAALAELTDDTLTLLRAPVLPVRLGSRTTYLEIDALILAGQHLVELRTFPCVDGVADPGQVAAVAREVAVTVLALRGAREMSSRALLVLPENFAMRPTGSALDVAPQVRRLAVILRTFGDPERILARVRAAPALPDPTAGDAAAGAAAAVGALPHRFGDGCLGCDLFAFCRREQEARGAVARLGTAVVNTCGGAGTAQDVLALAEGGRAPADAAERALADGLSRAAHALALADAP